MCPVNSKPANFVCPEGQILKATHQFVQPPTVGEEICSTCYECICENFTADCQDFADQGYQITPVQWCKLGYKPVRTLLSGSDECSEGACFDWGCECDNSPDSCAEVTAAHLIESCPAGCKKKLIVECGCSYYGCDPDCPQKQCQYVDNNGATKIISDGIEFYLNDDQCRPCLCDIEKEGVDAWCTTNKYTERTNPTCLSHEIQYKVSEEQCCSNWACCDARCPTVAECEAKHGPMVSYPEGMTECPSGQELVSSGKVESIKDPNGKEKIRCCEKFECQCPQCPVEEIPSPSCDVDSGRCILTKHTDSCGCTTHYTCQCHDCIDEKTGDTYEVGQIWNKNGDSCNTCCCTDSYEITCNNRRSEPLCEPSIFREKNISVNPANCPTGFIRVEITPEDITTIHTENDSESGICCPKYTCREQTCIEQLDCAAFTPPVCNGECHELVEVTRHCIDNNDECCCIEYACQCNDSLKHCPESAPDCPCYTTYEAEAC
jgi:hypothetical protein